MGYQERLAELGAMKDGWLGNGYGKKPTAFLLGWLGGVLGHFRGMQPCIFPTPEGGVTLEWPHPGFSELSVEISPCARRAGICAARKDGRISAATLRLPHAGGRAKLRSAINALFRTIGQESRLHQGEKTWNAKHMPRG